MQVFSEMSLTFEFVFSGLAIGTVLLWLISVPWCYTFLINITVRCGDAPSDSFCN
jgi:hypothetical protein